MHTKPRILIVDDDVDLCQLLTTVLETEGFSAHSAYHGYDALDWIQNETPDAIILDIMMPDIDGFELIQKLREQYPPGDLPMIMFSARMNVEAAKQSALVGADAWLAKSDGIQRLVQELKEQLAPESKR